jgi:hypothetical protein
MVQELDYQCGIASPFSSRRCLVSGSGRVDFLGTYPFSDAEAYTILHFQSNPTFKLTQMQLKNKE